jgi:hypothetical protein
MIKGVLVSMTTTNVIAILLFILPGILAEKISHKMDFPSGKKRSDFGQLITGIALSFPILFFVLLIIYIFYGYPTVKDYADKLNKIDFLLIFTAITLAVTIIFGIVTYRTFDKEKKIILFHSILVLFEL